MIIHFQLIYRIKLSKECIEEIIIEMQNLKNAKKLLLDFSNCSLDNEKLLQIIQGL